jgi:uncharacterized protein (TIGR02246 family)
MTVRIPPRIVVCGFSTVLLAATSAGCSGKPSTTADEAARADSVLRTEVAAFEQRWAAAAVAHDRGALNSLMAAEWTITLADGRRSNKTRALARWSAPPAPGALRESSVVDSVEARSLGPGAAVATAAVTDVEARATGADTTRTRVTDVLVRRDGRWQALVSHESIISAHPVHP